MTYHEANPTDYRRSQLWVARAAKARLIAENGPITLLELADLADAPIQAIQRTVDALEQLGVVKAHGRTYEWRIHSKSQTEAAIAKIAAGTYQPRDSPWGTA
jgi:DNA-binding MarR family transcriptional regulator